MRRQSAQVGVVIYPKRREEPEEQLTQEEILADLAANGFTEERLERIFVDTEHNAEYFRTHEKELFEQHPDKVLLIHSGGIVEGFKDRRQASDRKRGLNQDIRDGAIIRQRIQQTEGVWIL